MNSRIFSLPAMILLLIVWAGADRAVQAATRDITSYGAIPNDTLSDQSAIQAAINASVSGDTIYFPAGTFTTTTFIEPKDGTRVIGAGKDLTTVEYRYVGTSNKYMMRFQVAGKRSNIELAHLTLDGLNGAYAYANAAVVASDGASNLYLHDIRVKNLPASTTSAIMHGIQFTRDVVNCRIESCEFIDIGITSIWGDAIRVSFRSNNTLILNNTITNTGRGGILLDNDCTNVVIRGNTISGSGKASGAPGLGIELWTGCNYGLVEFNTLDHWLSLDRSSNTAVRGNVVSDLSGVVKYAGLELANGSQNVVFADNTVNGGAHIGWSISGASAVKDNVLFLRNQVSRCETWGVQLQGETTTATNLYARDSVFKQTSLAAPNQFEYPTGGHGFRVNSNVIGLALVQCQFQQNDGRGIEWGGTNFNRFTMRDCSIMNNVHEALTGGTAASLVDLFVSGNTASGNGTNTLPSSAGFSGNAEPTVTLQPPSPAIITVGQPVTFSASFSDDHDAAPARVLWDLGSGLPKTTLSFAHPYDLPGTYKVACVVWDSGGRPAYAETTVTANTPQGTWRQTYFGTAANSGNAADDFDFDKDGLANLAEYAFGLNPTSNLSRQAPQPEWTGSGFTVTFTEPAGISGVTYGAEWSTTLQPGSWTPVTDTGTAPQHLFSIPAGSGNRLFVRLKVTGL